MKALLVITLRSISCVPAVSHFAKPQTARAWPWHGLRHIAPSTLTRVATLHRRRHAMSSALSLGSVTDGGSDGGRQIGPVTGRPCRTDGGSDVLVEESGHWAMGTGWRTPGEKLCDRFDVSLRTEAGPQDKDERLSGEGDSAGTVTPDTWAEKNKKFRTAKFDTWNKQKFWLMQLM